MRNSRKKDSRARLDLARARIRSTLSRRNKAYTKGTPASRETRKFTLAPRVMPARDSSEPFHMPNR